MPGSWRRGAWRSLAAAMTALSTCSIAADAVREYLDETTAATITAVAEPYIFARERTDLAVNARDYVSLAALEINRAGQRSYHWFAYVWSTIDRRGDPSGATPVDQFVLLADGRAITLRGEARSLREAGVGQPPLPAPTRQAQALMFAADTEVFDYVAGSADLRVVLLRKDDQSEFLPWRDARDSLQAFVRAVAGSGQ